MSLSEQIYSTLLTMAFPHEFLREYREPLQQAFRDQLRATGGSPGAMAGLWANTFIDLAQNADGGSMVWLLCLAGMVLLGRYELRTDDTGMVVFFVLAMTFLLGCLHPQRAWVWALAALCVPAADVLWGASANINGFIFIPFVVTALGFAGSYSGAFFRRLIHNAH